SGDAASCSDSENITCAGLECRLDPLSNIGRRIPDHHSYYNPDTDLNQVQIRILRGSSVAYSSYDKTLLCTIKVSNLCDPKPSTFESGENLQGKI
ncbi:hypothetical protein TcasGA2_TC010892, partial [Tribolium castaneum]